MENSSYSFTDQNILLVVFTLGAVAAAFVLILLFDSLRRKGRRSDRMSRELRHLNPVARIFKRMHYNIDALREEFRSRARHKARMRDREH
jgi:hypothetical protein